MSTFFDDVGAFHARFGLPTATPGKPPKSLVEEDYLFRLHFMQEELHEWAEAYQANDMAGQLDALVDLIYVACGTAHLMGLPLNEAWVEVQKANMLKVRAKGSDDPRSKRKHSLDVVKPEGWRPPDIGRVIQEYGANR